MKSREVLIIDDEKDICFLLGKVLTEKNFNVSFANNLAEGLTKIDELKPLILFIDNRLTDGSGLEALPKIREQNPGLIIIMISAYDGINEKNKALEFGADFFIGKPLNIDLINKNLNELQSKY